MYRVVSILGGMGVILGAFGAHMLKSKLSVSRLESWHVAVDYHLLHAAVLLVLAYIYTQSASRIVRLSFMLIAIGIILFSGSIYVLSIQDLIQVNFRILGPVTPVGGLCLIVGWLNLFRIKDKDLKHL